MSPYPTDDLMDFSFHFFFVSIATFQNHRSLTLGTWSFERVYALNEDQIF